MKRNLIGADAQQQIIMTPNPKGDLSHLGVLGVIADYVKKTSFAFFEKEKEGSYKITDTEFECNSSGELATLIIKTNVSLKTSYASSLSEDLTRLVDSHFKSNNPLQDINLDPYLCFIATVNYKSNNGKVSLAACNSQKGSISVLECYPSKTFKGSLENASKAVKEVVTKYTDRLAEYTLATFSYFSESRRFAISEETQYTGFLGHLALSQLLDSRQTTEFINSYRDFIKVKSAESVSADLTSAGELSDLCSNVLKGESPTVRIGNLKKLSNLMISVVDKSANFYNTVFSTDLKSPFADLLSEKVISNSESGIETTVTQENLVGTSLISS